MKLFIAFVLGVCLIAYNPEIGEAVVQFGSNMAAFWEGFNDDSLVDNVKKQLP